MDVRDRFVLLFLPPYSPELNLIEILWKQAKYHWGSAHETEKFVR